MRPCGIIVLLSELFRAESISQVYATLHEFLRKPEQVSEKLGKKIWILYTHACTTNYILFLRIRVMTMAVICESMLRTL